MLSRPLPRSLDPLPGEGLDGFLLRLSYRLERSPQRIAILTGLIQPGQQTTLTFGLLMHLANKQREQFARATRLHPGEVTDLYLSSMADQYPPASPTPETRGWAGSLPPGNHWVFKRATRYCPRCLAGDGSAIQNDLGGAWQKTWRLAVVFACTKHIRVLEHLCPGCARPAHDAVTARGIAKNPVFRMLPQPGRQDLHPTQCRLPLASGQLRGRSAPTCSAELTSAPMAPNAILAGCEAIDLQERINNLLCPSTRSDTVSCGLPAATRQYFIDLRLITHLIRVSWPRAGDLVAISEAASTAMTQDHQEGKQQHHDRRGIRRNSYDVPPADAKTCAALLITADRLLQCQQPRQLTEHLRHMVEYDPRPPAQATWTRQILVGKPDCSPGLRQALVPILQTYSPLPAGRARGTLQTPIRATNYRPEHIAEFLQDDWYQRYFAPMTGINPLHLRRSAAIRLCQIAVGGSVANAAEILGVPVGSAHQSINLLQNWARSSLEPRQFETALHELADELDSAPYLVDYQCRRDALRRWYIDPVTWQLLLKRLPPRLQRAILAKPADRERQTASMFVWAYATQGEYALAPQPLRDKLLPQAQKAWRYSTTYIHVRYRAEQAGTVEPRLKGILDQYADTLAARIERGHLPESQHA